MSHVLKDATKGALPAFICNISIKALLSFNVYMSCKIYFYFCVFIFTIYQNRNIDLEMITLKPENSDCKNNTVFLNFVQQFRRLKTITHKRSCHGFQFLLYMLTG